MEMLYHYYYGSTAVLGKTISATTTWYAQSVTTPTAAYPVSKIRLYLQRTGDVGTVTVAIRNVTAGKPSGADLATATVASANIGTSYGWVDFNFASPYTLPADTPMAFVVRASLAGGTLYVADNDDAPFNENAFAYSSTNSGSTWSYIDPSDYSETFLFQIWGEDADAVQYLWASVGRNEPWGTNYVVAPMYYNGLVTTLGPGVITVAAGNGNGIALSEDKTRIFVGNGTNIRAFTAAYAVDTTWGTAGVFAVGVQIYGINVNSSGQVLVTHAETAGSETVSLVNAAGSGYVWRKKPNPAVPIDLPWSKALAGDGNVVIGINDNDGGSFDVNYRLSITDGSVLNSWRNETVFNKAARGVCSNADGSVIYAVFDDTMSATYSAKAYQYVPATGVITWTTPLTMRYAHGLILHSNGKLYAAAGTAIDGTIFQLDAASGGIENSVLTTAVAFAGSIWEMVDGHLLVFSTAAPVTTVEVFDEDLVSLHFNAFPTGASGLQLFLTEHWTQVAPALGGEPYIDSLAVFNSKLYGGTESGTLFEWNDVDAWVEVAPALSGQTFIASLVVFNNKLYGGAFRDTWPGIGPHVALLEWNGVDAWVEVAVSGASGDVYSLAVFNNKLYISTSNDSELLEWDNDVTLVPVTNIPWGSALGPLAVFNNKLYCGTRSRVMPTVAGGELWEWNGVDAWIAVAPELGSGQNILSLAVFNSKLYGGTSGNKLYEWNGSNAWVEVAPTLIASEDITSLLVFNNKLYGSTAWTDGSLLEWNGSSAWSRVALPLNGQTGVYSTVQFNNRIYGGTGPGGRLFEWSGVSSGTAPVITDQSTDTDIQVGDPLSLFVTATGTEPLSYQWYQGIDLLLGEINSTLVIDPAALEDAGTYTCQVSNIVDTVTSDDIVVTVSAVPPSILTQSGDQVISHLGTLSLYVTAAGAPVLLYQWYLNGDLISEATNSTYEKLSAVGSDCGTYTCIVTNDGGSVESEPIVIGMVPVILSHTADLTRQVGADVTMTVVADGSSPITYQWYKDGIPLSGQINPSLDLIDIQ